MAKLPKKHTVPDDFYWPLGSMGYSPEISDYYPEEAQMVGVITIMWNRIELALQSIFLDLLEPRTKEFGEAIWQRQPTHQARRDMLAAAINTVDLNEYQQDLLSHIIDKTKVMADRRNELMHAEYVVHGRTEKLHAKVKLPRSAKPAKFQKITPKDLQIVIDGMDNLFGLIEGAYFEFLGPEAKEKHEKLMAEIVSVAQEVRNRRNG